MIRELFIQDLSLVTCLWQSTAFVALGLVGGRLLRRRPSRAYEVVLFGMMAAVAVPLLSAVVKHFDLGAFVATETEFPRVSPEMALDASAPAPDVRAIDVSPPESTRAEAAVPASLSIPWRMVMLYGWIAATLVLLGRLVVTFLYGVYLVRHASCKRCEPVQQAADRAGSKLGIACALQACGSSRIRSPIVWCWSRRPILLVPDHCEDRTLDWTGVVAHELAHCRRRDHVTGLVAEVAASLLPWNPLMWVSKRYLVRLGEQACDDWVVAAGEPSEDYAESLLRFRPQRQMAFLPAVVHSRRGLAARVRRILADACADPRTGAKWALAVGFVAICTGLVVAFAQARPAPTETSAGEAQKPATSLHEAVKNKDLAEVKRLIAEGADIDAKDEKRQAALHLAAEYGYTDIARVLIAGGADVNARDRISDTPLHLAARGGHGNVAQLLLSTGTNVDAKTPYSFTPLHLAAGAGHTDVAELLIAEGADVNARNCWRGTPLHMVACRSGNRKTVELLLRKGADIHAKDKWGTTPLFGAMTHAAGDRVEIVELLVSKGSKIPASHLAAYMGDVEKLSRCLQDGMDVDSQEDFGCTALHLAVSSGREDIVGLLIRKGAAVDARDASGVTPLYYAFAHNDRRTAEVLLANGADIEAKDKYGYTLLYYAIWNESKDAAKLLIGKGVNVNIKVYGDAPLNHAYFTGDKEMLELLLANGADGNAKDHRGRTVLDWAQEQGCPEIVELLRKHGAKEESSAAPEDAKPMRDNGPPGASVEPAPNQSLYEAAKKGDMAAVRRLIAQGADVNARNDKGETPLHHAAAWGSKDVVEQLISEGADVHTKDEKGRTPLHHAALWGGRDIVELLISRGAASSEEDNDGHTPLYVAMHCDTPDRKDVVKVFAAEGAGISAIHLAAYMGDLAKVKSPLDAGVGVNAKDGGGFALLHAAASGGQMEIVEFLIASGADTNARDNKGATPLHKAARQGRKDVAEVLIAAGADIEVADDHNVRPLHAAAYSSAKDVAQLLIAKGADPNAEDNWGSPLHCSVLMRATEVTELLIASGADINPKGPGGYTALYHAVWNNDREMVNLLIDKGANVNVSDHDAWTPLHHAVDLGHKGIVVLLTSNGAAADAKDKGGRTPLSLAKEKGRREIVELLRKHGAKE